MRILITDWNIGLNKIGLTKAIRESTGLSLNEAKMLTDRVLGGEQVELLIQDEGKARSFIEEAAALGAVVTCETPH